MRYRSVLSALFVSLLLLVGSPAAVHALPDSGSSSGSGGVSTCNPGTPDNGTKTTSYYDPTRTYLGPEPLPQEPPVGPLVLGYKRFGNLTEEQFVEMYRSGGQWKLPPEKGFLVIAGQAVRYPGLLLPGQRIDRFGYPGGEFLSPAGDPFSVRSLPPDKLNTPSDDVPQSNYHVYCVLMPFFVDAGPAAPYYEQPGYGNQYVLNPVYLPQVGHVPCSMSPVLTVQWLIDCRFIVEERPV